MNCTCGSYSHDEKCDCKMETKLKDADVVIEQYKVMISILETRSCNAQTDIENYKVLTSVLDGKLLNAQADLEKYKAAMKQIKVFLDISDDDTDDEDMEYCRLRTARDEIYDVLWKVGK